MNVKNERRNETMKKKMLALMMAGMVLSLAGCTGNEGTAAPAGETAEQETAGQETATEDKTASSDKVWKIATDTSFKPFEYTDDNGNFVGIDMDILAAVAEDQGFEYEVQVLGWDASIAACQAGQADGMIAGASITEERKSNGWIFSDGYYDDNQSMAVAADSDIKGFGDLAGKQVAVKNGTMSDQYATELADQYGFTVVRVDDDDMMYQQVAGGQAAACFNDTVVLQQNIKKGVALKIVEGTQNEGAQYGFAIFDAKNQELIDLFNAGLANVKASGKYDEILAKYLG
jgi:polar amino acid transport system substrate-binding protein